MDTVKQVIFFETIIDNGALHTFENIEDVIVHTIHSKGNTITVPLLDNEDIPEDAIAGYLVELALLYLLPYLAPNHPAAKMARNLPRD